MTETDKTVQSAGIGVDLNALKLPWHEYIAAILKQATLAMPQDTWMQQGGKEGKHSEHLGYILAEMQFVQRTYPGLEW